MRSAIGGCVLKRFANDDTTLVPRSSAERDEVGNGLEIKRWAVALLATFMGILYEEIFSSAEAKPSG